MATKPADARKQAIKRWRAARSEVRRAADAVAGIEAPSAVLKRTGALQERRRSWRSARHDLAAATADGGVLVRWRQRRREAQDERLERYVDERVEARKRRSATRAPGAGDLPPHDWLKDAWR